MNSAYNYLMKILKYGDTVVVACSGGPDSMSLLYLLVKVKKALDINIVCAHVNHAVRKESDEEYIFVKKFCSNHGVIFEGMKIESYGDDNFHNEARTIRYEFFNKIVKKYKAKYLFTAHHGDDLMETILMRIVRGSTLKGYSGFSKEVKFNSYTLCRPLIEVTKDEIVRFLESNKIKYAIDASNSKDKYTRNRFRKYILPNLKKEDINVHEKFYKFSKTLQEYSNYIDKQVELIIDKVYPSNVLNIEEFKKCDEVIQTKILNYILEHIYGDDLMLITDHHVEILFKLINSKKANSIVYLPNNIKAIKSYNNLVLTYLEEKKNDYEIELIDYINLPNGKNIEKVKELDDESNNSCRLDSSELLMPLRVRNRMIGDKMTVKGMLGRKKIGDIFTNCKIDTINRETWPVVVDSSNQVVWIPGLKKSKFDKTKTEKYDIILKYY